MTLFLLITLLASSQDYTLITRGLVVGTETRTRVEGGEEFHTRFEFVREVDLKASATLEDGRIRSLLVSGTGYPWQPRDAPFPVGVLALRAREWEREGRPSGAIESCGSGCYALGGFTWGRSLVWLDRDGELDRAFVPTAFAPLVALPKGRESAYTSVLEEAARIGLESVTIPVEAKPLAIVGGSVLDVKTGAMHEETTVLVRRGRIEAVGYANLPIPEDAERLDAKGLTLLPGLWDMHAHLKQVEWLPAYLASGVTTVRDLGNETEFLVALREGLAARPVTGPRVLAAGFIDATPAEGSPYTSSVADTPEQGRNLVRRSRAAGFDAVKVWSNVAPETLSAITSEAHALGLPVTGHVPQSLTLEEAIARGLDQVDHVGYVTDALARGSFIETLRAKQIVVDPTLVVSRYATRPRTTPLASYEPCAEWMPKELVEMWSAFGVPAEEAAEGEASFERALATVKRLHDGGVTIVAGSDQGLPGCTLLLEIELYVRAGIPNLDAIRAATLVPARVMGLAGELGAIAPGMRADLILVDGNPLKDIRSLRYLRRVIRDGVALDPWELRRLAALAPR